MVLHNRAHFGKVVRKVSGNVYLNDRRPGCDTHAGIGGRSPDGRCTAGCSRLPGLANQNQWRCEPIAVCHAAGTELAIRYLKINKFG